MQEKDFRELLKKYNEGGCTEQERATLESWYLGLSEQGKVPSHDIIEQAYQDVRSTLPLHSRQKNSILKRLASAAAIILVSAAALYLFQPVEPAPEQAVRPAMETPVQTIDAMPGGNRAILTLSDGSAINLDDARKGELAKQGGTGIQKTRQGELVYNSLPSAEDVSQMHYNTISTPRGGQYQVTLPDGTKVWLNAASSLRFPVKFSGMSREVSLSGEAYFEVAENKLKPFLVSLGNSQVEVLGTHFNIMSYPDEVLTATLLEGSVKFKHGASERTIVPGQAAQLLGSIRVSEVNTADAVAWKNGVTAFSNADIPSIMRQISRWYDLDVVYQGAMPDRKFTGKIPRTARMSRVLKVLELSDINFRLEDKRIIVTP